MGNSQESTLDLNLKLGQGCDSDQLCLLCNIPLAEETQDDRSKTLCTNTHSFFMRYLQHVRLVYLVSILKRATASRNIFFGRSHLRVVMLR